MKRIIINGANGYVASNFINQLLIDDYEVVALVRRSNKLSASQRMNNVLFDINDSAYVQNKNLKVFSYVLTESNFSLGDDDLQSIFSGEFDYYHFAASLKYDFKSRDEIFETNINGVENSLSVYHKYANENSRLFFISTAYSCGKLNGTFDEKFYANEDISAFRNYYEQSKRFAENIVKKYIDNHGVKAHVVRLSQVVGNSVSGVTKTDYGIFDFAKRMYSLANRYPNKRVRLKVDPEATQNLIPINTVVHYLMKTVELDEVPDIMNFIAKNSIKNSHIIECVTALMPIDIIPVKELPKEEMSSIERLVSVGMSFTGSYISTKLSFDTTKLDCLVPISNVNTEEKSIAKMLEYFVGVVLAPKVAKTVDIIS